MFWRYRKRLDEEIEAHLAHETEANRERGMDPLAARSAALRTFGSPEVAKEIVRELDPLYWLDTLWQDLRFALRFAARNRWTNASAVATLTMASRSTSASSLCSTDCSSAPGCAPTPRHSSLSFPVSRANTANDSRTTRRCHNRTMPYIVIRPGHLLRWPRTEYCR